MASNAAKARRRALALHRMDDLAVQTADHFGVEVPDLRVTNRDPELAQIQQVEATADLLESILKSQGVEIAKAEPDEVQTIDAAEEATPDDASTEAKTSTATKKANSKKKSQKRTTRRK